MDRLGHPSIFNCSICSQPYSSRHTLNKGGKVPLVLHCGHSACDSCITRLIIKPGDSLTCQICKSVSKASDIYNTSKPELEFPQNSVILGKLVQKSQSGWDDNKISFTVQTKPQKSPRAVQCHECVERRAEVNCAQCQVPYCTICFDRVHQIARAFKDHVAMDLTALANIETKCSVHNENLQFWCEPCSVTLCSNCLISTHIGHTVSLLVAKNTSCLKDFLDAFTRVSNIQARLQATRKKAASSLSKLENTKFKNVELKLREHFSRLHGLLITRENNLLKHLYSPSRGSANSLKNMLQQIDLSIEDLDGQLETCASLIEYDTKYLSCASYIDALQKLESKQTTPCFLVVSSDDNDSSKFMFEEDIFEKLESHGQIDVSNDVPIYRLVTEEQLPPDFTVDPIKALSVDSVIKAYKSVSSESKCGSGSRRSLSPAVSLSSNSQPEHIPGPRDGAQAPDTSSNDSSNRNFDELVEGCKVKVIMTHATSPNDFYVRRLGLERKLMEINLAFSKLNLKTPAKDRVKPGDFYMAQFTQDNRWYRSSVTQVDGNLITVFYIDFGNTETVKRESLRLMPHSLMKYDGMALHCSLHNCIPMQEGRWTPQTITTMLKITDNCNGDLSMSICRRSKDILYVDLLRCINMDMVSLRHALIFLSLARPSDSTSPRLEIDNMGNQRPLPQSKIYDNGYVTGISITHCVSPYEFYIQDIKNSSTVKQLTLGLHEMYSKKSERSIVYHPKIGMIVAAMNGNDNEWRRARITGIPDYKKVQVMYIDFGNTEVISYKRLRYLGHKFFKIGSQCSKCRLIDIMPVEGDKWSGAVVERFSALVQLPSNIGVVYAEKDKAKMSLVVHGLQGDSYKTVLFKDEGNNSICINAALVQENLAISTGTCSTLLEIPSNINEDSIPRARKINKERRDKGRGAGRLREFEEGSQALAEVRAILLAQSMLPNAHQSMPLLPQPQSHSRPRTSYLGNSTASLVLPDKLTESGTVKPLAGKCKEMGSTESYVSESPPPESPKEPIKLPVQIVKVVSPSEFYVTPVSLIPKLDLLKSSMQKLYSWVDKRNKLVDVFVGSVCVIKRVPQEDWCRAVVVNLLDDAVEVSLPDFGDVLTVNKDELFMIEEKFLEVRDGATRCHLGGLKQPLEDRWPMTSTDEIVEFADKYDGKIYITKLGEERANSLPVEVLMREEVTAGALEPTKVTWTSLNNNLRMRGLALADGTIDWNVEDFKFVSEPQQIPRLKIDVFKGITIKSYAGVADTSQVEYLEEISNAESIFGSGIKVTDEQKADDEVVGGSSLSRLSISDINLANDTVTPSLVSARDDKALSQFQVVSPQVELPIPVPVMPKAWLPPLPFSKLEFLANPTNVNNDASIFLQDFQKSISSLRRIGEILDSHCRMSLPMGHDMYWSVGQTCIARYHLDQKWYRGLVKSINEDNTVMVELVDYGNVEECCVTDLRKMPLAVDFPIQGQFCNLTKLKPNTVDGKWTIAVLDMMHALVVEKHCLVKLSMTDSHHSYSVESIKLPDGSEMLANLVKKGVAVYNETLPHQPCSISMTPIIPVENSSSASTLDLPEIISETDLKKDYSTDLTEVSKDCEGESDIRTKCWVEQCEELMAEEDRAASESEVQQVHPATLTQSLTQHNVPSRCSSVSDSQESLSDHTSPIEVPGQNQTYEPDIYFLNIEFPKSLTRFEVEVLEVFVGCPDVVSFHVTNSIDLQLSNSRERFLNFSKALQVDAPLQPLLQSPHPNDVCCAEFSEDGLWYRALILEVPDEEHVVVKYVDYGNVEKLPLTKIREMKEEWSIIEVQLMHAKLDNLEILVAQDKWHCVKYLFEETLLERKLTAVVIEHEPVLCIELYEGDKLAYQNVIDSGFFKLKSN